MANALYSKGLEAFATAKIDWENDVIKAILVDLSAYTPDLLNHQFLSDIPAPARISTSAALTGKTATNGICNADDITFPLVSGPTCEAVIFYKDTGVEATSRVIAYFDTAGSQLPITPGGSDISLILDNGANKLFRI